MARHFEPPATEETRGPSVLTLALVVMGALLAIGAAFFVRPAPRIEDKAALSAPVVPAALLAAPVPVKPVPPPEVAKAPSLPADKERLALAMAMAEKSRSLAPQPKENFNPEPEAMAPASRSQVAGKGPQTASAKPMLPGTVPTDPGPVSGTTVPSKSDGDTRKQMTEQATAAIVAGDIPGARQLLEQSIASGDKQSVLALAETYDPVMLSAMKIKDVKGDPKKARELYEKARKSGIRMASKRLAALRKYERSN